MIHSVRLRGFRRYRDASFELRPGVNFIDGPNNAGKTTILYAIEYALFGRVGGFATQTALLHPGERGMGVELCFTGRDGLRYRLQRVHARPPRARTQVVGHFTLKRQAEPDGPEQYVLSSDFGDTQEALAIVTSQVLGMTPRTFDVAVHLRQGRIASILAGAPELDNVLGVTAAVIAAEEMRALALENEKEAATLPRLLEAQARASSDVETAKLEVLAAERDEAERQQASERLDVQRQALEEKAAALTPVRADLDALLRDFTAWERAEADVARQELALDDLMTRTGTPSVIEAELEAALRDVGRSAGMQAAALEGERELAGRRRALDRRLGDVMARLERRATASGGASCESCGQPIDAQHATHDVDAWQREREALEGAFADLDREVEDARAAAATHETAKAAAYEAEREARAKLAALTNAKEALDATRPALDRAAEATRSGASRLLDAVVALRMDSQRVSDAHHALAEANTRAELEGAARLLTAALTAAHEALLVDRARLAAEADHLARSAEALAERLAAARSRSNDLAKNNAWIDAEVARLTRAATVAADVRVLAAGFKELQVSLRDRAAETLAADTKMMHRALSGGDDELLAVRVDPAKYALYVTPNDVGEDVPAYLFQGGGHQLLLGLAFKLAVARLMGVRSFLLLDEPTYGLDRDRRAALLSRLADLDVAEQLVVITHHDVVGVSGHRVRVVREGKHSEVRVEHEQGASV